MLPADVQTLLIGYLTHTSLFQKNDVKILLIELSNRA